MTGVPVSRRAVLGGAGALVVAILRPPIGWARQQEAASALLNERIELHADGTVHLHVGKVELGQGFRTAIAQLAAEDVNVEIRRIRVEPVDTATAPNDGTTAGSNSIENTGTAVRRAAAQARHALLAAAARDLGVPASTLTVRDGTIESEKGSLTYWTLLDGRMIEPVEAAEPEPAEAHTIVGRHVPRTDLPAKVTGGPSYVHDLRLEGMVHARTVAPPAQGATLEDVDTGAAAAMPGMIKVVRQGSFLAVVAEREEQADRALVALRQAARWREPEPRSPSPVERLRQEIGVAEAAGVERSEDGQLSAVFEIPYRMHGAMGPSCAVARDVDGDLTVWTHSQGVFSLRSALSGLLDMPAERVRCIHMEGAGCFGHNGADDVAAEAAVIARAVPGRPVRLQWTRADEHGGEPYGPPMVIHLTGRVADGRIASWTHLSASGGHASRPRSASALNVAHRIAPAGSALPGYPQWGGGARFNANPAYDVPAEVETRFVRTLPLRTSALRSLGAYANVVAIESFVDELAGLAAADPVAFRLSHLRDPRARAVIEKAAGAFGWEAFEQAPNRGRGFGFAQYNNHATYVAVAAEVALDPESGTIRVVRMVGAADCGEIVSPDGVRNQIEGGMVQAASWTLKERVAFTGTRITSRDWSSYPILRMSEAPRVTVHLIDRPGMPFLGAGEAAQGPAGAAVANAFAMASGRRATTLPLEAVAMD